MSTQDEAATPAPDSNPALGSGEGHAAHFPPGEDEKTPGVEKLTKEEQMALYEEHLKETDWGHQPC